MSAAQSWAPASIPRLGEMSVDWRTVAFATGLTAVATVLLSAAPFGAIIATRAGDVLRSAGRGSTDDRWNQRVRHALVTAEISAAMVLMITTTILIQSVLRLQNVHPGFSPDAVFQARLSLPPTTYQTPDDLARFYDRLSEKLRTMPGVQEVGVISVAPLSGLLAAVPFTVADRPPGSEREKTSANIRAISPGYLPAVGTRLIQGRPFQETDRAASPPVALVSSALASRFMDDRPLGRQILIDDNSTGPRPVEVVGVVEDVRQTALDAAPALDIYIPLRQIHPDGVPFLIHNQFWMVRTDAPAATFRVPFLAHLRAVDPDAAIAATGTMRQYIDAWLGPRRFNLGLFGVFSLAAVLLAVSGLYGLVSYAVSQRRREIGLRMAIGASEHDVRRLILRQAAGLGAAGTSVGLCLAYVVRPLVSRIAQDLSIDPAVAAATAAFLMGLVTLAAWLPARRAARIQPLLALRGE
jgi:predicted permease